MSGLIIVDDIVIEDFLSDEHLKYRENSDVLIVHQEQGGELIECENIDLIKGDYFNEN